MNNQNSNHHQPGNSQEQPPFSKPTTGLFSLPPAVMNIIPWLPLMLEMTTGQKIPQMTGTIGEIQHGIQTIQMTLGQIVQQQQNFNHRLTALETNASQQFTNLVQQVQSIKSVRLTHDRERKQLEFSSQQENQ